MTALGTLIPGAGLIAAGRRHIGGLIVSLMLLSAVLLGGIALLVPTSELAGIAGDPQTLGMLGVALALVATAWLLIAVISHRLLEPVGLRFGQRLAGALVVVVLASLIVGPLAVGSRYAYVQQDLVGHVFDARDQRSLTTPKLNQANPWEDKPRVNLLLLGSDAGKGREGIRPDTNIVASIDTRTGDTVMFSLPRNLQKMPFPEDSPLHDLYPRGFQSDGEGGMFLFAVYRNVPRDHPDVFQGVSDPGADAQKLAVSGALDLPVDYYLMVNLKGFQTIVQALGGVEVNVNRRIPMGNKQITGSTRCTRASGYIEPGPNRHLDGHEALWFARSRCGSDDYDRMHRQRCVINAMIDQADPVTLLTRYQQLASATKEIVSSDIPQDMLPAFIDLSLKMKDAHISSVSFDPETIPGFRSSDPDYTEMHDLVRTALAPQPKPAATTATPGTSTAGPSPTKSPTETKTPKPSSEDVQDVCAYKPQETGR